jgi:hypothetical protein
MTTDTTTTLIEKRCFDGGIFPPQGGNGGFRVDFYTLVRRKRFNGGNFHLMHTNLLNGGFQHHFEWLMVEIPTPMGGHIHP